MDDQKSADGLSAEDARWIAGVLDEHGDALLRYAGRLTADAQQARDIVQDTFLRLCGQSRRGLEDRLRPWLFAVCRNLAVDLRKKESRTVELTQTIADSSACVRDAPEPFAAHMQAETESEAIAFLAALPGNQQEVIRLKIQEDFSYREIAHITGLSESNVGYLIHTGLKTLRLKMGVG